MGGFDRPILKRASAILALTLLVGTALHILNRMDSRDEFVRAHVHEALLFGDSHADNVPWGGRPRFSAPAQDLFATLKMLEELAESRTEESKVHTCVITIWPNKFSPLAERRISGRIQKDGWGANALGRVAPLMKFSDFFRSEVTWRYRLRMAFHTLQFKTTWAWFDKACHHESVSPDFFRGLSEQMMHTQWFAKAHTTRALFERIVDHTARENLRLILVENPSHPCYYQQVYPPALHAYQTFVDSVLAGHPDALFINLNDSTRSQPFPAHLPHSHELFTDYHHLTCKGEALVGDVLTSILD